MRFIKRKRTLVFIFTAFTGAGFSLNLYRLQSSITLNWIPLVVILVTLLLTVQGIITLMWMLYAWEDPDTVNNNKSPVEFAYPSLSFTALVPARHEEKVIRDTIIAINKINYPDNLKEILVLCREDDVNTINRAAETITELGQKNIRLVTFDGFPINKPHGLNIGLWQARNSVVTIFDAEDEPHPDIYQIINTVMIRDRVDVVQSGVQLMNFRSHWFSALNVMEYFLWFKSGLHFFLKIGQATPLGGNTVFFKKEWLKTVGGWDENCLTEDADIGIRLALAGAKTRVIYDEKHSTQEETPPDLAGLIKQRTRWNQGFIQILQKGDWAKLPSWRQRLVILYVLFSPITQALFLPYIPFSFWVAFTQKLPVSVSLLSFVPLCLFILQVLISTVGLFEFTRAYKLKFPFWMPLVVIFTFIPYQIALMFSSFRALYRIIFNNNSWEKTQHLNDHRQPAPVLEMAYVK
ncbi:MAG: glycosyltransferase [Candidatus Shapirobacteria bacterium]|jgi:cellulose synthase/poly-beta-1,6-N-acetylglucosamine synthase-like glycosyltransferase